MTHNKLFQALLVASVLSTSGCIDMQSSTSDPGNPPEGSEPPTSDPAPATKPQPTSLTLNPGEGSKLSLGWQDVGDEDGYRVFEQPNPQSGFTQIGDDLPKDTTSVIIDVPIFDRDQAAYLVEACNAVGCSDSSNSVQLTGNLSEYIDYFKAPNSNRDLALGRALAVSSDGNTMAVGAPMDDSAAPGINTTPVNEPSGGLRDFGAVHVYVKQDGDWVYDAYIKPSVIGDREHFGWSVALSGDGTVLAVGMPGENSGDPLDPSNSQMQNIGTTILFKKDGNGNWSQTDYIKPVYASYDGMRIGENVALSKNGEFFAFSLSDNEGGAGRSGAVWIYKQDANGDWLSDGYLKHPNPTVLDYFGRSLDFSADGQVIAVGSADQSCATTINGDASNTGCDDQGSVSMFYRDTGSWVAGDYIKAPNGAADDEFGATLSLSDDGTVLAVGAPYEKGSLAGINPDMSDKNGYNVGAIYLFKSTNQSWALTDFIKPASPVNGRYFAGSVDLTGNGETMLVGAIRDNSVATGINGNLFDESSVASGGAYIYKNDAGTWALSTYLKAPNNTAGDNFGTKVVISSDGSQIAIGAPGEDGDDTGINSKDGVYYDNPSPCCEPSSNSGAVYGF